MSVFVHCFKLFDGANKVEKISIKKTNLIGPVVHV